MDKLQSIDLYRYIFEYLQKKEYLQFINTNKEFDDIKRATIQYTLYLNKNNTYLDFWERIKFVKDPRKQIYLIIIVDPPDDGLIFMSRISTYLNRLRVATNTIFTNDFDFSIFNNIPNVFLGGFRGVTEIRSGLQNIQHLQLLILGLEKVYDFNETGILQSLQFNHCLLLKYLPNQRKSCPVQSAWASCECLSMTFSLLGHNRLDMTQLFTHHLEQLELVIYEASLSDSQINVFIHIPDLYLRYDGDPVLPDNEITYQRGFSSFYGYKLHLDNFDLSSWVEDECEFPELCSLELFSCILSVNLPHFPKIKSLELEYLLDLEVIPSYPRLYRMDLTGLYQLVSVFYQPKLDSLKVITCPEITNLNFLPQRTIQFSSIVIVNCGNLIDILPSFSSLKLEVYNCQRAYLPSLTGLNDIKQHCNKLRWSFENFKYLERLETIRSFESISLANIEDTDFGKLQISNIQELSIAECIGFQNTDNISNIKERLLIDHCHNLTSLQHLQHTQKVALSSLPRINDISGLGHHEHLYLYRVPYIVKLARAYADSKKEGREALHPFHNIFGTIHSCTILKRSTAEDDALIEEPSNNGRFYWFSIGSFPIQETLW